MSELSPTIVADVVAACSGGAAEAAGALSRSLDGEFSLGTAQSDLYASKTPDGFAGPGLVVLLTYGAAGLAIALPESSGLLPPWYAAPDVTGESKLSTLAQELSMLLVPDTLAADKFEARRVESLSGAIAAAGVAADAAVVTLEAKAGAHAGAISIIWPLSQPAAAFAPSPGVAKTTATSAAQPAAPTQAKDNRKIIGLTQLPPYSRSLLKIRIPVSVHLATKKETVKEIVELVPGSIIKFEKGCDELLHMAIGGQAVAVGEAVKIGDKFGFRVTSMLRPQEHFLLAQRSKAS